MSENHYNPEGTRVFIQDALEYCEERFYYEMCLIAFQHEYIKSKEINEEYCGRYRILFEGRMTDQEKLFQQFFAEEKVLVKDMDTLQLRSHREQLQKIAFEAKARLYAADDEEKDRSKRGVKGFSRSVTTDDVTSDAINRVAERQKKLTKADKMIAGFEKLGMDKKAIESIMSARNVLTDLKNKVMNISPVSPTRESTEVKEEKPFFNPFVKKVE